jgi:outer membrane protein assembly factor BamB
VSEPTQEARRDRRFAALALMVISALFSGMVIGVLVAVRMAEGPVAPDLAAFEQRKEALSADPTDEALLAELRARDMRLREDYWAHRRLYAGGAGLLLVGVALVVVCGRWYASLDPKKPAPSDPVARTSPKRILRLRRAAVTASAVVAVVLVAGAAFMAVRGGPELPPQDAPAPAGPPPEPVADAAAADEERYEDNWPVFRGPSGIGLVEAGDWPQSWDVVSGEGIVWTASVPMPGKSSPVIWGGRIFLSGADEERREVFCYSRASGDLLWRMVIPPHPSAVDADPPEVFDDTGFAAPTPATDGRHVYALFATADLVALDFAGDIVWHEYLGEPDSMYGIATSPTLYDGNVIVQFDQGARAEDGLSRLLAFDGQTGREAWSTERPVANSWSSPAVALCDDRDLLITCAKPFVIAYDPANGTELWRAKALSGDVAPSPVCVDGVVYVTNEYAVTMAIRTGGEGDVTESHVLWENDLVKNSDAVSPVCDGDYLFQTHSSGIAACQDAKTGAIIWEKEWESPDGMFESFWASPLLAGSLVYLQALDGRMYIFELGDEYREVATGLLEERIYATPAFADGHIYIRGEDNLYCIGPDAAADGGGAAE